MAFHNRLHRRTLISFLAFLIAAAFSPAQAAEKMRLRVDHYQIDAELSPHVHKLAATAKVTFTALEDLNIASFELHNGLRVTKVLDASNKPLDAERVTQDSSIRVQLPSGMKKDASTTLTFEYEGQLDSADDSPVQGLKVASIGDDTSYLLYAGRWFPVNAYGINRFTATMNVTVPAHMLVIGSGKETTSDVAPAKKTSASSLPDENLLASSTTSRVSRAPSSPEFFRTSPVTRPGSIPTYISSPLTKTWPRSTRRPRSRNTPTTSRFTGRSRFPAFAWSRFPMTPCPPPGPRTSPASPAAPSPSA